MAQSFQINQESSAETMCRLCFTECYIYRLIFTDKNSTLVEWIESLTTLKIIEVPGAPASLCLECQTTLQNFESFREMCFTNDCVIKGLFSQNDRPVVSKTIEATIDHNDCQETVNVDSTIDLQIEIEETIVGHKDIKIALDEDDNKKDKQLDLEMNHNIEAENNAIPHQTDALYTFGNSDCNNSSSKQSAEDAENTVIVRDVKRKRDVDGKLPSKDEPMTKGEDSAKHKKFVGNDCPPFKCELCFKEFASKYNLEYHTRRHFLDKKFICSYCDKGFCRIAELTIHIPTHTKERSFKCPNCDMTFTTSSNLTRHKKIYCRNKKSSQPNKDKYECEYCSRTFTTKWRFEAHTQTHTVDGVNSCSSGNTDFNDPADQADLKTRVGKHTQEKPFKCGYCDLKFAISSLLKQHIQTGCDAAKIQNHINYVKGWHKCEECDASFHTETLLLHHKQNHPEVKRYICKVCNAKFSSSGNLLRHMRDTQRHTYTCEVCQMKFTSPEHLEHHKKEHLAKESIP